MKWFILYILLSNLWIIYRIAFKFDKTNDISKCKNIFILILRYLLTVFIGFIDYHLLFIISCITGGAIVKVNKINKEAQEIKKIIDKDPNQIWEKRYDLKLMYLMHDVKFYCGIVKINKYIVDGLSTIRKKLII